MTSLLHPHIDPPLVIDVEDERVPEYVEAGWLLVEPNPSTPDPDAVAGPDSTEETE